jgi:hypothetical protein
MNKEYLEGLKAAYQQAVEEKQISFYYQEKEFLVSYAKYLLQYMESDYE